VIIGYAACGPSSMRNLGRERTARLPARSGLYPVGLGFVFSPSSVFNNMARFVLGSFPVRFFHRYVFSTTSPLRFWVRFRFVFDADPLFSTTSPVRFQKKVFFFVFPAQNRSKKELFPAPQRRLPQAAEAARLPILGA
jgi:hypothetical protein